MKKKMTPHIIAVTALVVFIVLGLACVSTADVASNEKKAEENKLEKALTNASKQALSNVPAKSKIAIVYITAKDGNYAQFIANELEFIWVNDGFFITDRSQLEKLRQEQNFQMSGEVDDDTAVSIGKFAGADVIVTGSIDGDGNLRRLRLRVLNTQTAQVMGAASEKI
jgi:curli biogenesis system outer membrane secretion channel CsgG